MRVNTDTTEYRMSHGAEPRGRGGWLFEFEVDGTTTEPANFNGTHTEARREAVRFARATYRGAGEVVVVTCP